MVVFSLEDVRKNALQYFSGDELAADAWVNKYALRNSKGELLENSPDQMHRRLAKEFARIESNYENSLGEDEIYSLLKDFKFIVPQGSPMSAIGNPYKVQSLSNCFVVENPEDSYGSILRADQEVAQIQKRRGGVGVDISHIRPRGVPVKNAAGTSDGIGIFMERFSNTTEEVAQGGRRGALMQTIHCAHPDIERFITIKLDGSKVRGANVSIRVTDEFMKAVVDDSDFTLRWPVESSIAEAKITKVVRAKDLWKKMIEAVWGLNGDGGEPGILFWDRILGWTPADIYANEGFKTISTNPCLTGDTKVAVADGRGYVEIKTLAEEGLDIPVYACDNDGKIVIRTMRNPRLTGRKVPVCKVTVEGGHQFRATPNHKMRMIDGSYCEVKDLKNGDQLSVAFRRNETLVELTGDVSIARNPNHYKILKKAGFRKSEHRMIWEHHNQIRVPKGFVIHHKDFNSQNNAIENLECMSSEDHKDLHAREMLGDKNPMRRAHEEWSPEKWVQHRVNMSAATSGENNARAFEVSNEQIKDHLVSLTKILGRRIAKTDWIKYATENDLPRFLNDWRNGGKSFYEFCCDVARECGLSTDKIEIDSRMARRLVEAESQGYECRIDSSKSRDNLEVLRKCEWCKEDFWANYDSREVSICSTSCSNHYVNSRTDANIRRTVSLNEAYKMKGDEKTKGQLNAYTAAKFRLRREPFQKEWVEECKKSGVSARLGTKHGIQSWPELKEQGNIHNHRVISVEFCGEEDVYNGTVDEFHNFYFGGYKEENPNIELLISTKNCGELPLCAYDSCRLLVLNLLSYVKDPFLSTATFDFELFNKHSKIAQRLMDDIIDLELEAVDKIISKIQSDPEHEDEKIIELRLWKKIREKCTKGRRTGTGITALGDAVAALGIRYSDEKSIEFVEKVYRELAIACHTSSVQLAKERGSFPVWKKDAHIGHPFMEQLLENSSEETNEDFSKYGRRNIALTTTAPAGTVSLITQTTSGIEPVYKLSYSRRRKVSQGEIDTGVIPDETDSAGIRWKRYEVYHPGFKKWMDATGKTNVEESPYFGATANEIDWVASIDLQAVAQKWIEHSISKTCNLPENASIDTLSDVYMHAWKSGCKGLTAFRENSRKGVLSAIEKDKPSKEDQPLKLSESHAPKRPKELPCDIHRVKINGEDWTIIVGLFENRPFEIFGGLSKFVEIPKKKKQGRLIKNPKGNTSTYNVSISIGDDDELLIKDVVSTFDNLLQGTLTRVVSLSLRHGVPVQYICEQLVKDKSVDMQDFSRVLSRVLKGYIQNGTKVTSEKKCPECSSDKLGYQEGCVACTNCGWSKCS